MVEVKASTSSRTSISSFAPRTTARRTNRFGARAAVRNFSISRTPIILELNSQVIRVGYAEQAKPQHTLLLDEDFSFNRNLTETQWYNVLSPIIIEVYDRLMCNPTTRRVVLLLPYLAPTNMVDALHQNLWNKGVPAIAVWSNLEVLPLSQGWKRGLIVNVGLEETVSVCHADGHVLPFTYHNVPVGYKQFASGENKDEICTLFTPDMEQKLLNENDPNSVVVAVLKTLEQCPREVRPYCVANMVFCGEGMLAFPDIGRRVALRVKAVLEGNQTPIDLVSADRDVITAVPIDTKTLMPLANKVKVTSTKPYRPDWIAWVGASLWAAVWNRYDDEESKIQWVFAASD